MSKKANRRSHTLPFKAMTPPLARPLVEQRARMSPLAGMSPVEAVTALQQLEERYTGVDFDTALATLREEVSNTDPVLLLAQYGAYELMSAPGEDNELTSFDPILQHHVELLQALLLMRSRWGEETKHKSAVKEPDDRADVPVIKPSDEDDASKILEEIGEEQVVAFTQRLLPPSPEVKDLVRQVSLSLATQRLDKIESASTEEEAKRLFVQEMMRGHTQAVRNWAYPQQILRIITELFTPLEDRIEHRYGVRAGHLLQMLVNIEEESTRRVNDHRRKVRSMLQVNAKKGVAGVFAAYDNAMGGIEADAETANDLERRGVDVAAAKQILFRHSMLLLPDAFTFSLEEVQAMYPAEIEPETLRGILDGLAYEFGGLAGERPDYFLLSNPVWERPLIRLEDGRYFWPIPVLIYSFALQWLENIIAGDADIKKRYEDRRGDFLEEEAERLMRQGFPGGEVFTGSQWRNPTDGRYYENDVMVVIDAFLILVEAKAGRMPAPARRGAPDRLKHKFKELIVEPSEQSERFVDYLKANPGLHRFTTRRGVINEVDTTEVRHFVRINVTLDDLGQLSARSPELQQAGLIETDKALPPTIAIAELEMVFELLDGVCPKLHYLSRRAEFERHALYMGDECDLLTYYLDTGFNIGEIEFDGTPMVLRGLSKMLDSYFMRQFTGMDVPKPTRRLTPWWRDILARLEMRRMPRWTEIGYTLLNVAYDDQKLFEDDFRRRITKVRRHRYGLYDEEGGVRIMQNGPPQRRDLLVGMPYFGLTREVRNNRAEAIGEEFMQKYGNETCIVLAHDVDREEYPYSLLGCFYWEDDALPPSDN